MIKALVCVGVWLQFKKPGLSMCSCVFLSVCDFQTEIHTERIYSLLGLSISDLEFVVRYKLLYTLYVCMVGSLHVEIHHYFHLMELKIKTSHNVSSTQELDCRKYEIYEFFMQWSFKYGMVLNQKNIKNTETKVARNDKFSIV